MSLLYIEEESVCPPVSLRVGKFLGSTQFDKIPFNWNKSFVIETNKRNYNSAVDLTQNIILQIFLKCKQVSCTVLQHISNHTFDVLESVSYEPHIYGVSTIRQPKLMEDKVTELQNLIIERDELLARYGYKNWGEYLNNKQVNLKDKYQILCISEIESCPLSRNAQYALFSEIMVLGPRLGIIVFCINSNSDIKISRINKIRLVTESKYIFLKLQINYKDNIANEMIYNQDVLFKPLTIREKDHATTLLKRKLKAYSDISPINVVIGTDLNDSNTPFSFKFSKIININGGILKESNHALIAGATGAGKSTLIKRIGLSICEKYSPNEVQFFIVDYKKGVDFMDFDGTPHCPIVFGDISRPDFFEKIFDFFVEEYQYRTHILATKPGFNQFEQYFKEAKKHSDWIQFPRWILIIDEAHAFLSPGLGVTRELRKKASDCVNTITKLGRYVGMHLILSTQSFRELEGLSRVAKGQCGTRISMLVNDDLDCTNLFNADNYQARKLQPLQGVFNDDDFSRFSNQVFEIKEFAKGELVARLYEIKNKLSQVGGNILCNPYTKERVNNCLLSKSDCDISGDKNKEIIAKPYQSKSNYELASNFLNQELP